MSDYRIVTGRRKQLEERIAELEAELAKAKLHDTWDKLKAARWAIVEARNEAETKAIDALARYKFQMFGYWAACWVHANRQAKAAGMEDQPSPFYDLVQAARRIQAGGES